MLENFQTSLVCITIASLCLFTGFKMYLNKNRLVLFFSFETHDKQCAIMKLIIKFYFAEKKPDAKYLKTYQQNALETVAKLTEQRKLYDIIGNKNHLAYVIKKELDSKDCANCQIAYVRITKIITEKFIEA